MTTQYPLVLAALLVLLPYSLSQADPTPRTREEVLALIEAAGQTKPDWWDSTQLEYPKTLDLSFPPKPGGDWNSRKNVGQYMWSIINENAHRFKQGTKFMHYVLKLNADNPETVRRCQQQLGHCYHDLLQDWARAAYWKRKAGQQDAFLANAYWQLGNKEMASTVLEKFKRDLTRYGTIIKQWADMGEFSKALAVAQASFYLGNSGAAYRALADAYRGAGQYDKAVEYYQKVIEVKSHKEKNLILKHNQDHARTSIETIRIFESFDPNKLVDGKYQAAAPAYNGDLEIEVKVLSQKITAVKVLRHTEKQYYSSLVDMPEKIINAQDFRGIDATSGATVTADAIKNAAAKALAKGAQ